MALKSDEERPTRAARSFDASTNTSSLIAADWRVFQNGFLDLQCFFRKEWLPWTRISSTFTIVEEAIRAPLIIRCAGRHRLRRASECSIHGAIRRAILTPWQAGGAKLLFLSSSIARASHELSQGCQVLLVVSRTACPLSFLEGVFEPGRRHGGAIARKDRGSHPHGVTRKSVPRESTVSPVLADPSLQSIRRTRNYLRPASEFRRSQADRAVAV